MGYATIPNPSELNILNRWLVGASSIKIRLFTNNVTIGQFTGLGDLTEGTWDNYTPVDFVVGTPATDGLGRAATDQQTALFTGPTSGGTVTSYGWYVTLTRDGTTYLWMAKNWDGGPKSLGDDTDIVAVVVRARFYDPH